MDENAASKQNECELANFHAETRRRGDTETLRASA